MLICLTTFIQQRLFICFYVYFLNYFGLFSRRRYLYLFLYFSGALEKKQQSELCYKDIVKMSSNDSLMTSKQIEKDLLHTMPTNACYSHINSTGIPRLRRTLRGLAWLYPDIGYGNIFQKKTSVLGFFFS